LPRVFCIGAANGLGKPCDFNSPKKGVEKYSVLGKGVLGASIQKTATDTTSARKDGTSAATAIAAGVAALFIEYGRQFDQDIRGFDNMQKLFLEMSKETEGCSYRYLAPWSLFPTGQLSFESEDLIEGVLSKPPSNTLHCQSDNLELDTCWTGGKKPGLDRYTSKLLVVSCLTFDSKGAHRLSSD
jgi:hypothetical protein